MAFTATVDIQEDIAKITLGGELDAATAPILQEKIEEIANNPTRIKKLVLLVQKLTFMASAGLRILIFAKQKMGGDVDIYVVGAQETILDTLEKTGVNQSVIIMDKYPA
ncbi:MAG: anti-sigma factor antagonist [Snowella sp.]|nr:anti-sigma factor antagonist [Snowella sp.]